MDSVVIYYVAYWVYIGNDGEKYPVQASLTENMRHRLKAREGQAAGEVRSRAPALK